MISHCKAGTLSHLSHPRRFLHAPSARATRFASVDDERYIPDRQASHDIDAEPASHVAIRDQLSVHDQHFCVVIDVSASVGRGRRRKQAFARRWGNKARQAGQRESVICEGQGVRRDEGRGTRDEGRGTRDEGRGRKQYPV